MKDFGVKFRHDVFMNVGKMIPYRLLRVVEDQLREFGEVNVIALETKIFLEDAK